MTTNAMFMRAGRRIGALRPTTNNVRFLLHTAESNSVAYSSPLRTSRIQRVTTVVQQGTRRSSRSWHYAALVQHGAHSQYLEPSLFHRRSLSDKASSETAAASEEEVPPPQTEEHTAGAAETEAEAAAAAGEGTQEGEQVEEPAAPAPEMSREETLENEIKELKNNLLRSLAEQENTRMIAKKDVDAARNYAIKSFAKGLLDVSDNLSRAMDAVPEELRRNTTNDDDNKKEEGGEEVHRVLATLYEGIHMTEAGLTKAFQSNGLVKFGQDGDVFDPNVHNALFEFPDEKKAPGTVGQVIKNGFLLNSRVLRPAEVGVVKKS